MMEWNSDQICYLINAIQKKSFMYEVRKSPKTEQLEKWHGDHRAVRLQMALVREDVISEGLRCM